MPDEDGYGVHESAVSVSSYTTSTCSTSVVIGLSNQIAEEVGCMNAGALVKFNPSANLQITSSAVLPYLNGTAKTQLEKVAATNVVRVNSAFRTVAQQYLLFVWNDLGRCGITAAAPPGRSNHEGGRALDIANYSSLVTAMANKGWAHNVPGDPVHFEYLNAADIRGRDVLAFQRLWNRNNPTDKISEDGSYGPQTESRLRASPATGFTKGAICATVREQAADVVMIDAPDKLAPGAKANISITLNNTGEVMWPASTKLLVADGGTSGLYDSASWVSAKEVGTIGTDVPAGEMGAVQFTIAAPMVTEEMPLFTQFVLSNAGAMFGTINIGVTVTPNGDEDTSSESDDMHDDGAEVTGGCNAGGAHNASWLALLIPALVLRRRRRR
jgi:Synergist-CTERM protein sorting domain-containing protein